jgi:hypothetical protein
MTVPTCVREKRIRSGDNITDHTMSKDENSFVLICGVVMLGDQEKKGLADQWNFRIFDSSYTLTDHYNTTIGQPYKRKRKT